ncbi:MAG TPA: GMC oxidoreductase, partial [Burkholderiaceae bacterium]
PLDEVADLEPRPGPVFTVHPLGGCGMGNDKDHGVVDDVGRVFAVGERPTLPGLVVLDGAIVPVALGINPALTIAALAERALPRLADEWQITLDPTPVPQAAPRPRRRDLTQPRAPEATRFTLHERMTGRLMIGDGEQRKPFDASALIDFDAAAIRSLRKLPRIIKLARVEVTLSDPANEQPSWTLQCSGEAEVLVRDHSNGLTRVMRALEPARRRLAPWASLHIDGHARGRWRAMLALCSRLGAVRLIRYTCKVTQASDDAPLGVGAELQLTKRIAFTDTGNPWRQLSEGMLERVDGCNVELGTLSTDLSYFVEQMVPLLQIERQQDAPNALGDLAELALWILRVVLHIHLLNFLPAADGFNRSGERMPGAVDGVEPETMDLPQQRDHTPVRKLSLYRSRTPAADARPVLLIHGYGASGSTFTHPSIGTPLVASLMKAGRNAWVVELRTSIALSENKTRPWPFDVVANEDIADAIRTVRDRSGQGLDGRIDVVAHCVGAAMFSVAVLSSEDLHRNIGCVALSQVSPLVSGSPMNRFRAFVAAYLQQYLGIQWFDVRPITSPTTVLVDAILNTFPYPDGDGEAERLRTLPGFAAVRHRADAIFGQTMRLSNIGDDTLKSLDAIYGFVSVPGLAQVGHYVAQHVLTDGLGQNQTVEFEKLATRFNFPLLVLHGRHNGVFDWRGSYRAIHLLKQVFDKPLASPLPPVVGPDGLHIGEGTPRQLRVLGDYGHQDTLIGEHAHRDVFVHITTFLDDFKKRAPSKRQGTPPLVARWPSTGPTLGAVSFKNGATILRCRLALRPPRGHASTLAVALIPATRDANGWHFDLDLLMAVFLDQQELIDKAMVVDLNSDQLPSFQGFAVVTVHTELPLRLGRDAVVLGVPAKSGLFATDELKQLTPSARDAVEQLLANEPQAAEQAVVRLDPAWIAAVPRPKEPPHPLCFALASCQYPAGLFDAVPAQGSYQRLVARLDDASAAMRPQLLLLAGDQVYVDETAGLFAMPGAAGVERAYEVNHRLEGYRRVTRSLPTYPLLDDHEVSDDWEPPPPVPGALDAYVQRQHKLVDPTTQPPFHGMLAPAGLPVFALDTRTTREP